MKLSNRLERLEKAMHSTDNGIAGVIELEPGQSPLDGLAGAGTGMWFILDAGDEGSIGVVRRDGSKEIIRALV